MRRLILQRNKVMSKVHGYMNICQIISCFSLRAPYCQYCLSQTFQCIHHIKFLFHCGVLLRRLRIQLRAASSWASLPCPHSFTGLQSFPSVPHCHSLQLPCMPCRSQSSVVNLDSPWDFSANSVETGQWKDQWSMYDMGHQFISWSSAQDTLIRRGKGCEEKK